MIDTAHEKQLNIGTFTFKAPKIRANKFPFNSSIVFHTINTVSAPKNAGKNLTQKKPFPSNLIM